MKKAHIALAGLITLATVATTSNHVSALDITSCNVSAGEGVILVDGTAEEGVLAATILVHDETDANRLALDSVSVSSDHTYSDSIEMSAGTYVVHVADYDSGNFCTKTVTVASSTTPTTPTDDTATSTITSTSSTSTSATHPDTGQMTNTESNSAIQVASIGAIAVAAIVGAVFAIRKFRHRK